MGKLGKAMNDADDLTHYMEATARYRAALQNIASLRPQAIFLDNYEESFAEAVSIAQEALDPPKGEG